MLLQHPEMQGTHTVLAPLSAFRIPQENAKPRLALAVFKVIVIHMDWAVVIS